MMGFNYGDSSDDMWAVGIIIAELVSQRLIASLSKEFKTTLVQVNGINIDFRDAIVTRCSNIDKLLGSLVFYLLTDTSQKRMTATQVLQFMESFHNDLIDNVNKSTIDEDSHMFSLKYV